MCILHFSLKKNRFIIYFARMCPTENQDFNRSEIILDLCAIYPMGYSPIISPIEDLVFICQHVRCVYSFQHTQCMKGLLNSVVYFEYD